MNMSLLVWLRSISIGMKPDVFAALDKEGISSVHNSGNAANTNKGVRCLDSFLGNGTTWDVISFQFGLHDLAYDIEQLTQEQYRGLLTNITQRISNLNTQVVWTTTTPVPNAAVNPPRYDSDGEPICFDEPVSQGKRPVPTQRAVPCVLCACLLQLWLSTPSPSTW